MSGFTNFVKVPVFVLILSASLTSAADRPRAVYFFNPGCRLCTRTNIAVAEAEKRHGNKIDFERINIGDPKNGVVNMNRMYDLLDELGVPEDETPELAVFLGIMEDGPGGKAFRPRVLLKDADEIVEKIDQTIRDFLAVPTALLPTSVVFSSAEALAAAPPETPDPASGTAAPSRAAARAQKELQFVVISVAALADSVNPCAFATIIILISMMSSAKRTRREIIAVCLSFTAAVFMTYFAIGLFLYNVVKAMMNQPNSWYLVASDLIYYAVFALCVVCAFLSARDAYMLHAGRSAEEMVLQLPKAFKTRINVAMAKGVRARWLVLGVFVTGVSVSFLEAACTGQVYLPTTMILAQLDFWTSILLLIWYNFLFVLPLLIIFGIALYGISSQRMAEIFKKNVKWTKVALTVVFLGMAAFMWLYMYWPPGYRG